MNKWKYTALLQIELSTGTVHSTYVYMTRPLEPGSLRNSIGEDLEGATWISFDNEMILLTEHIVSIKIGEIEDL